jgi:hypothetical protein
MARIKPGATDCREIPHDHRATSRPIWLIGCGNMAGAMLAGWLDCGLDPAGVTVMRPSGASRSPRGAGLTAPRRTK